jgi:hypothetical protein
VVALISIKIIWIARDDAIPVPGHHPDAKDKDGNPDQCQLPCPLSSTKESVEGNNTNDDSGINRNENKRP